MIKRCCLLLVFIALIIALMMPANVAYAGGTTTITASGGLADVGNNGSQNVWVAQSFQVASGHLTSFTVTIGSSGSPVGTITYEFRTDNSGNPGGTVLSTGTFSAGDPSISVSGAPLLLGSTTYWLILKPTVVQSSGNRWKPQISTAGNSTYADGQFKSSTNGGSSWVTTDYGIRDMDSSFTTTDATPTPSNTPTPSLTPTITLTPSITPTPDFYDVSTLVPSGQETAIVYKTTAGQAADFGALVILIVIELVSCYVMLRKR